MAMEFEGFSMREYTSRMRSLNVVNCWPFDESDEYVVKSLLPPITVKKFTWWFDVLELSRSESIKKVENSKKKKKKIQEKGESSLRNQEYIEESDFDAEEFIGVAAKLKTFRGKMKPKAPKERSIKELFAVAPPVDRVSTEEDEEDDDFCDSKEIKWGLKGKRNEKKKNLSKLKKPKKKIKKKININEMDISVDNKEACFKLHLPSQGVVKAYKEPFAPYLYKLEKRSNTMRQFPPQSTTESHSVHAFEYQSFPHLSPKELLRTSCALPEVNQKRIDGDFVGLPLNSHGELIELNSSGKSEFQQTIKPSIGAASSIKLTQKSNAIPNCLGNHSECRSWECRTSHRDQSNMLKRNDHSFNTVERDLHPEIESFHGRQEDYQKTRNCDLVLPHLVQSKMRLMGKEFIVSGNGLRKDNQMIAEHHSGGPAIEKFTSYSQNEPSLGNFKETSACLSETEINHRSESMLRPFSQFALQRTNMDRNDFVASKRNPVPGLHPCLSPGNSSAVHYVRSILRDPIIHGYGSKIVSSEFPMPRPAFQGLPHAPRSVIRFPFLHPDLERHAQSSWSQRSPKNMSPLFFDVAERETLLSYGQAYSNLGSSYGSHPMPGTSCWTDPRLSLKRETFCLHSSFTSGSSLQNSIAPAPLTQCAVSCYSGILPNSVLQKRHGSQLKFKEPFRSRTRKGHSHGKKARKRASAASVDSFKPMKMPELGIQEASNFSMTKSMNSVSFEGEAGNIGQSFQSDFVKNKETIMACGEYWNGKDENTVLTGKDPFSGTVSVPKTKHILEACQRNRSE